MTPFNFLSTKTVTVFILEDIKRTAACIVQCTASTFDNACMLSFQLSPMFRKNFTQLQKTRFGYIL